MNICVVGTGYVGLVTGACFAELGNRVTCVDNDESKIGKLVAGEIPIFEPGLDEIIARNTKAKRLFFTTELPRAIQESLVVFIAVGTPPGPGGRADLSFVKEVAKTIAENLHSYKVIVTKSTVPAGTGSVIQEIIEEFRPEPHAFSVASNPEFLREGAAIEDFMRPNRVVLGAEDEQAAAILKDVYRPLYLIETPFVVTDVTTAELIKHASNAFLAMKISFINEMADLCEKLGADVHDVARGMGLDQRIGRKFLHPGLGYGGSCFPKDTRAIKSVAEDLGIPLRLVEATIAVNDERPALMLEKVRNAFGGSLHGKTIAQLGLAFKPNTNDVRESPALSILTAMVEEGATVRAYDPAAMRSASGTVPASVVLCANELETLEGADGLVVATEWNQFRGIDPDVLKSRLKGNVVCDLRNVYDPSVMRERGFDYVGVGR
jgi:UDPglucose 6-dehydrogenase